MGGETGAWGSACRVRSYVCWGTGARENDCTVRSHVCGGLRLGRVTVQ